MYIINKERKIIVLIVVVILIILFFMLTRTNINIAWSCGQDLKYNGDVYGTIKIGNTCVFKDNLNTEKYRNGEKIKLIEGKFKESEVDLSLFGIGEPSENSEESMEEMFAEPEIKEWEVTKEGAYSNYENNANNSLTYGKLYNFYAVVDVRGLCPQGWRVPSDEEWMAIEKSLGMCEGEDSGCTQASRERGAKEEIGNKLKKQGAWESLFGENINQSNFSALPGGLRSPNAMFMGLDSVASFWTSTEASDGRAWIRNLRDRKTGVYRLDEGNNYGASVRCIKN